MRKQKAQSTLEYVLVLTAIIAVVAAFAAGFLRTSTKNSLEHVATQMQSQVQKIDYSNGN
ncbi:MAG: hypothetical protein NTY47_05385 [Candidatus Omnitrophica bacterium]|nr:hypothetical protein [Candidatus Omnitrophota bacterium]